MKPADGAPDVRWRGKVEPKDLDAAEQYLRLRLTPERAEKLIKALHQAELEHWRVNDLLRACDREPLGLDDRGVKWKLDRVVGGKKLTPAIAVSFDGIGGDICQGFHELSISYVLDPFSVVPVFLAYEGAQSRGQADD